MTAKVLPSLSLPSLSNWLFGTLILAEWIRLKEVMNQQDVAVSKPAVRTFCFKKEMNFIPEIEKIHSTRFSDSKLEAKRECAVPFPVISEAQKAKARAELYAKYFSTPPISEDLMRIKVSNGIKALPKL